MKVMVIDYELYTQVKREFVDGLLTFHEFRNFLKWLANKYDKPETYFHNVQIHPYDHR